MPWPTHRRGPTRINILVLLPGLLASASAPLRAQDIEVAAQLAGRSLPSAYYQRVAREPRFFTIADGWIHRAGRAAQTGTAVTGALALLVVNALFADSPEPVVSAQEVQRALFDGPSTDGTLTEFYAEASGERFTVRGRSLPWVRSGISLAAAVGRSFGLGGDAGTATYLQDALARADSLEDFGLYDNDGPDGVPNSDDDDGRVDAVAFQFVEVAASCGGPGIWPHRARISSWTGSPYVTDDRRPDGTPIVVDDYIIQSAVGCGGTAVQTAATIAHELGHVLGLPDLYDAADGIQPEQRRWVLGCWSLMAAGSWGCGAMDRTDWRRPTHFSPWERIRLGWLAREIIAVPTVGREISLEPAISGGAVLRIPLTDSEYFLVEYRKRMGFDRDLPASGVLIYHIDTERPIRPCRTCPKIYQVALEEADGNDGLVRTMLQGGNRGEPGDAFGWFGAARFTTTTTPSTRLNTGARSTVSFHEIVVQDSIAVVRFSTELIAFDRLLQRFLVSDAAPLTPDEEAYLDSVGNRNGRFDIGDVRAYLRH